MKSERINCHTDSAGLTSCQCGGVVPKPRDGENVSFPESV